MLAIVAIFVLSTGSLQNCLFVVIIFVNSGIGIVTELKAKRTLDALSILIKQHYIVDRNGSELELLADEIVEGDLVTLPAGSQIPVDGEIVSGEVSINESMLTGESVNIVKSEGDSVLSGTSVVVGECVIKTSLSGGDSYVANLTQTAKEFKVAPSDLRIGTDKILKYISFIILPIAILLVITGIIGAGGFDAVLVDNQWKHIVLSTAGGIIGMIPEGLVLLTSMNFALASIILARQKVLVTELNSVETLARVNEIILDKTGTITDGSVEVTELLDGNLSPNDDELSLWALYNIVNLPGGTSTSDAINEYIKKHHEKVVGSTITLHDFKIVHQEPFDSAKKFSSITVEDKLGNLTLYKMGAPEFICPSFDLTNYTREGKRVLAMASQAVYEEANEKNVLQMIIVCQEHIRESIFDVLKYFKDYGVNVRVVSGDNEETVRAIAAQVGIDAFDDAGNPMVVGRAKPETKLEIVRDLQKSGRVVAMTGDGVNDMLALKEADLGIAMGNASNASKAVANLVLIDSNFGKLPSVVGQGRRVIANIERVASLFLVKTFYSIGLALVTVVLGNSYPFLPIHLTVVSAVFIGIPAFFLALPPNNTPYQPGFLKRVIKFSLPFGLVATVAVTVVHLVSNSSSPMAELITIGIISAFVLLLRSKPILSWRGILFLLMVVCFGLIFFVPWFAKVFLVFKYIV